jgi:hypothetical protein
MSFGGGDGRGYFLEDDAAAGGGGRAASAAAQQAIVPLHHQFPPLTLIGPDGVRPGLLQFAVPDGPAVDKPEYLAVMESFGRDIERAISLLKKHRIYVMLGEQLCLDSGGAVKKFLQPWVTQLQQHEMPQAERVRCESLIERLDVLLKKASSDSAVPADGVTAVGIRMLRLDPRHEVDGGKRQQKINVYLEETCCDLGTSWITNPDKAMPAELPPGESYSLKIVRPYHEYVEDADGNEVGIEIPGHSPLYQPFRELQQALGRMYDFCDIGLAPQSEHYEAYAQGVVGFLRQLDTQLTAIKELNEQQPGAGKLDFRSFFFSGKVANSIEKFVQTYQQSCPAEYITNEAMLSRVSGYFYSDRRVLVGSSHGYGPNHDQSLHQFLVSADVHPEIAEGFQLLRSWSSHILFPGSSFFSLEEMSDIGMMLRSLQNTADPLAHIWSWIKNIDNTLDYTRQKPSALNQLGPVVGFFVGLTGAGRPDRKTSGNCLLLAQQVPDLAKARALVDRAPEVRLALRQGEPQGPGNDHALVVRGAQPLLPWVAVCDELRRRVFARAHWENRHGYNESIQRALFVMKSFPQAVAKAAWATANRKSESRWEGEAKGNQLPIAGVTERIMKRFSAGLQQVRDAQGAAAIADLAAAWAIEDNVVADPAAQVAVEPQEPDYNPKKVPVAITEARLRGELVPAAVSAARAITAKVVEAGWPPAIVSKVQALTDSLERAGQDRRPNLSGELPPCGYVIARELPGKIHVNREAIEGQSTIDIGSGYIATANWRKDPPLFEHGHKRGKFKLSRLPAALKPRYPELMHDLFQLSMACLPALDAPGDFGVIKEYQAALMKIARGGKRDGRPLISILQRLCANLQQFADTGIRFNMTAPFRMVFNLLADDVRLADVIGACSGAAANSGQKKFAEFLQILVRVRSGDTFPNVTEHWVILRETFPTTKTEIAGMFTSYPYVASMRESAGGLTAAEREELSWRRETGLQLPEYIAVDRLLAGDETDSMFRKRMEACSEIAAAVAVEGASGVIVVLPGTFYYTFVEELIPLIEEARVSDQTVAELIAQKFDQCADVKAQFDMVTKWLPRLVNLGRVCSFRASRGPADGETGRYEPTVYCHSGGKTSDGLLKVDMARFPFGQKTAAEIDAALSLRGAAAAPPAGGGGGGMHPGMGGMGTPLGTGAHGVFGGYGGATPAVAGVPPGGYGGMFVPPGAPVAQQQQKPAHMSEDDWAAVQRAMR